MQFQNFLKIIFIIFLWGSPVFSAENPVKHFFEQATKAYGQGKYQEAIELYEKTLSIYPNFAPAYNFLGLCHKEIGTGSEEIISIFKKAIAIDPNYALAYDNLAKTYYMLGEYDNAEENALKALEINPQLATSQLTLGWVYLMGKSQPGDAVKWFEKVTKDTLDTPYANFGLGMAYFMDHQSFKTLEMITKLRKAGREDLANQLEEVVRSGQYIPPSNPSIPLVMPQKQKGVLVTDRPEQISSSEAPAQQAQKIDDMQVLLRGKMPRRNTNSPSPSSEAKTRSLSKYGGFKE